MAGAAARGAAETLDTSLALKPMDFDDVLSAKLESGCSCCTINRRDQSSMDKHKPDTNDIDMTDTGIPSWVSDDGEKENRTCFDSQREKR